MKREDHEGVLQDSPPLWRERVQVPRILVNRCALDTPHLVRLRLMLVSGIPEDDQVRLFYLTTTVYSHYNSVKGKESFLENMGRIRDSTWAWSNPPWKAVSKERKHCKNPKCSESKGIKDTVTTDQQMRGTCENRCF